MMSQPGYQTMILHILPSIMGQLIEFNKRNIFSKNHAENEAGRLVGDLFLFFKVFI